MKIRSILALLVSAAACSAQGIITTVAGSPTCCNSADGGQATSTWLTSASGIARDSRGNMYLFEGSTAKIRKIAASGIITTVAGNGNFGYSGDGGLATAAALSSNSTFSGVAVDADGNIFISQGNDHVVRKVNTQGIISTVAGTGSAGFSGDGGQANKAMLQQPAGIAVDGNGNLYIADSDNQRVRMVNTAGIISTVAGNGNVVYSGDGVQASATAVHSPEAVAIDGAGNLYIAETSDSRVRKVAPNGIISTLAGQTKKTNGFSGDGGLATAATLAGPIGLVVDASGNVYIADNSNGRVRKVDAGGIITTYAGITGTASTPIGDGGPATSAFLGIPKGVVLDSSGNLYISGSAAGIVRVRRVAPANGFAASPTALAFAYSTGGAAVASKTVNLTSNSASGGFTAAASTTSGGNWLSVGPTAGTAPATLTVSVNPTGLPAAVYQGAITVTPAASGASPLSFAVSLTVTGAGAPTISTGGIVNASGYQTTLAPDTVFVIFGSGMGPATLTTAAAPDYPTSLAGTSITFTPASGGSAISAKMVYTLAGLIAGVLPSSITPGTYAVRVTYNTLTSAPQNVTVAARSFGIATSNSAGSGTPQATIGNINGGISLTRFTSGSVAFGGLTWTLTPAHPGDTLVLWGTGGGADPANDTGGTSGDQTQAGGFIVNVGGRQIVPLYAGAATGYPGLWQINFTLPLDIPLGCFTQLQVITGANSSNAVIVPIAAAGQNACSDPSLNTAALAALDAGGAINIAGISTARETSTNLSSTTAGGAITSTSANQEIISATFFSYTPAQFAINVAVPNSGACVISDHVGNAGSIPFLDAGQLTVAGPGLASRTTLPIISVGTGPVYDLPEANGTLAAGTYNMIGNGGKDVGPFNVSVPFPASFTVAGWDSMNTIDRTKPLTVSWSGSGFSTVTIIGASNTYMGKDASGANIVHTIAFTCQSPASAGTFTVPVSVVSLLQPEGIDTASHANGYSNLTVEAENIQPFPVSLTNGASVPIAAYTTVISFSRNPVIQ